MKKSNGKENGRGIRRKSLYFAAAVLMLCACSKEESNPPLTADDLKIGVTLTPRSFGNQLYTSYLYQIPFLTEYRGVNVESLLTKNIFKLSLVSPRSGAVIEMKMHGSEINEEVTERYTLPRSGDTLWMQPCMVWKYDALRRFDKTRNLALRWTVSADGIEVCTINRTFSCRSISQCVYSLLLLPYECPPGLHVNENGIVEMTEMFAGYVEEENPEIDRIMDQALREVDLPNGFDGYLSGEEGYLKQQMCAIWYVLQQRGITYSNAVNVPGAGDVPVQNVRFFSQVLANSQANCVEGSCMLASIYQRISLFPYLISTPDHMFLGIGDAEGELTYFLETTLIGSVKLDRLPTAEAKWEASKENFQAAMDVAAREFEEMKPHLEAGEAGYAVLNLNDVRETMPSINYGSVQTDSKGRVVLVK